MSLPRLFLGVRDERALTLAEHELVHGPLPRVDLIDAVEAAGLRGRGGAAFPTARKLRSVAAAGRTPSVLVNAAEGEPMSRKDRVLCEYAPHLVLDGAFAAADAVGAREVIVALPRDATAAIHAMRAASAERRGRDVQIAPVPVAYLAGEERALIRHLEGGPLKPTAAPPRPFERGLRRRPTLVNNPETLAHVALVARHGPAWFREVGTAADPGSALVTLGGAVADAGVQEIASGARLTSVIGGTEATLEPLRALLVGGYHGAWIDADALPSLTLDSAGLGRHGATLAAGVIVALGVSACPVQELRQVIGWLGTQSAGQCGPCSNGLPAIADLLGQIAAGRAPKDALPRLERWSGHIAERGACRLPDGAARFLRSGMRVFAPELKRHAHRGPCAACARPATLLGSQGRLAA